MEQITVDIAQHKYAFAIPAYDGKVQVDTMTSLLDTVSKLSKGGIGWNLLTIRGSALIDSTRNELTHKFLHETDADILICIDSDVSWPWESMERLLVLSTIYDSVAGVYCSRTDPPKFHLNLIEERSDAYGLLRHNGTGMGFVSLKRQALEEMKTPVYNHPQYDKPIKQFFRCEIQNGIYTGEDIVFFRDFVNQGFVAKADVNMTLSHHGPKEFKYQLKEYLDKENLNGISGN